MSLLNQILSQSNYLQVTTNNSSQGSTVHLTFHCVTVCDAERCGSSCVDIPDRAGRTPLHLAVTATSTRNKEAGLACLRYSFAPVLWIRIRIYELPGSGSLSVFGIWIQIHTCKYRMKWRQKMSDLRY